MYVYEAPFWKLEYRPLFPLSYNESKKLIYHNRMANKSPKTI